MPDFNKGDFTQQGVAGHVNANLRLNEKRLVNIDMTSNEEAEGCTITGTVKDLLNDKVYNIGSGVSGNIEITENGENINVAPFATATVNVAGGGELDNKKLTINFVDSTFSDATMTIQIPILSDNTITYAAPTLSSEDKTVEFIIPVAAPNQPWIYTAPGYSTFTGSDAVNCQIMLNDGSYAVFVTDPTADASITIQAVAGGI